MKHTNTTRSLQMLVMLACLSLASYVSASNAHRNVSPTSRAVNFELYQTVNFFGALNTSTPIFSGTLLVKVEPTVLFSRQSGGDNGGGHENDDSTGGDDSTHDGGGHDSTDNDGGNHGGGGHDSTDNDGGHHGGDTTDIGGNDGDSTGHDSNDTLECDGHGHHGDNGGKNDSLDVEDSSSRSMFNGGHQSIVIKTSRQKTFITFNFTNNLTTNVAIKGFALTSGTNFSIASAIPTAAHPINLAAGAKVAIKVAFNANDTKAHTDQLQIFSNANATASIISLQGINTAGVASVTSTLPAGVSVSMTPNPMYSILKINIAGARNATVAIYDMLGKQIFTQQINADFQWNGNSNDGIQMPNGTFIARLSGESTEGAAFVVSQKVMLQR